MDVYSSVSKSAFGLSMGAIWQHMRVEVSEMNLDYESSVNLFFSIMECLMLDGQIKLANSGEFLLGSVQDQLNLLRISWPKSPGEDDLDGFGFWFLVNAPAGIVWFDSQGKEFWT